MLDRLRFLPVRWLILLLSFLLCRNSLYKPLDSSLRWNDDTGIKISRQSLMSLPLDRPAKGCRHPANPAIPSPLRHFPSSVARSRRRSTTCIHAGVDSSLCWNDDKEEGSWTQRANLAGCIDRERGKRKAPGYRAWPHSAQGAQKSLSNTDKTVMPMTTIEPSLMASFCSIPLMSRFSSVVLVSSSCFRLSSSSFSACLLAALCWSSSCFSSALTVSMSCFSSALTW